MGFDELGRSPTLGAAPAPPGGPLWSVASTADGRTLATATDDGTGKGIVSLWDLADRAHPVQLGPPLRHPWVSTVAFTPDGRLLAIASADSTVVLWDVADPAAPRPLGRPLRHPGDLYGVAFTSDGLTLAASTYQAVTLWDVAVPAAPRPLGQPLRLPGYVSDMAFTSDGRTLATASDDVAGEAGKGIVSLWDLTDRATPRRLGRPLTGHTGPVRTVAFSPDGRTLASAGDNTVRLWDLTELNRLRRHPAERACALTGRGFDPGQWAQSIPGLPYQNTCP